MCNCSRFPFRRRFAWLPIDRDQNLLTDEFPGLETDTSGSSPSTLSLTRRNLRPSRTLTQPATWTQSWTLAGRCVVMGSEELSHLLFELAEVILDQWQFVQQASGASAIYVIWTADRPTGR